RSDDGDAHHVVDLADVLLAGKVESVSLRIAADHRRRHHPRYVLLRLRGETAADLPEAPLLERIVELAQAAHDPPLAGVVRRGGEEERGRAEDAEQVDEIVRRGH